MRRERDSRLKTWLLAAAALCLCAVVLRNLGVTSPVLAAVWDEAYNATEFFVVAACGLRAWRSAGTERTGWAVLALGLLGYAAGDLYYTVALQDLASPPYPSLADAGYLSIYPAAYVALVLLLRARAGRVSSTLWLDGLVCGLAVAGGGRRARLRRGGEHGWAARNRGDEPGLPPRRPHPARVHDRGHRDHRPAGRIDLDAARSRLRGLGRGRLRLPLSDRGRDLPRVHHARHDLAGVVLPDRARGVAPGEAARRPAPARRHAGAPGRLLARRAGHAGLDHYSRQNGLAIWLASGAILAAIVRFGLTFRENLRTLSAIGKVAIPDAILHAPRALDEAEWEYMRQHTIIGERIIGGAPGLLDVARIVRSSHERHDGRGYPDRLSGDEIPLAASIVSVCDAYDAMVSERAYRAARSPEDALAELRRCAGTQFHPGVVAALVRVLRRIAAPESPRILERSL